MSQQLKLAIGIVIIFILLATVGGWLLLRNTQTTTPVVHTIVNVPYYGLYNAFPLFFTSQPAAALMVLAHYGDSRFSAYDMRNEFFYNFYLNLRSAQSYYIPGKRIDVSDIARFFNENGYIALTLVRAEGNIMDTLREAIANDIPVIVFLRPRQLPEWAVSDDPKTYNQLGVLFGIDDTAQTVTLHEYEYGNNHVISQEEFISRFSGSIAVTPSVELLGSGALVSPLAFSYSDRIPAMETLASYLEEFHILSVDVFGDGLDPNAEEKYEEFIERSAFNDLHPFFKLVLHQVVARIQLVGSRNADVAIKTITERVIPLNHDLNRDFNGWQYDFAWLYPGLKGGSVASPEMILANAYALKGDNENAIKYYRIVLEKHPNYNEEAPKIPGFVATDELSSILTTEF